MNFSLLIILSYAFYFVVLSNIDVTAWVQPGYYYGHRCQVSFKIISSQLQSNIQVFNLFNILNAFFIPKQSSQNSIFVSSLDSRQMKMAYTFNCPFDSYQNYQCIFINTIYNPASLNFKIAVNATFSEYIFRVEQVLCPSSINDKMIMRIQMPIQSDYANYYTPAYNSIQTNITKFQLSYSYDMNITIQTGNLTYLQTNMISFLNYDNFLVGCLFQYQINFIFQNASYYQSWNEINVLISDFQLLSISTSCSSDLLLKHVCQKTNTGFKLTNNQPISLLKSLQLNQAQYFLYQPFRFSIYFNISFISQGSIQIISVILANQTLLESNYKVNFSGISQYGYSSHTIYGLSQQSYNVAVGSKYSTIQCLKNNEITTPLLTSNLIIFLTSFFIIVLMFFLRKQIFLFQKFLYLALIFVQTFIKILFLSVDLNLQTSNLSNSLYGQFALTSTLQDFLIKNIFILQFLLSFIFSLVYLISLLGSSEILNKIKWMYGKKNQCDGSTVIFLFLFVFLIIFNFKFYSIMLFKLHLNTLYWKKFKKYRLKNEVAYVIHFLHLVIDLFLEIIALMCLSLILDTKTATYASYLIIFIQILQIYLLIIVIKCFYIMARNSNLINSWQLLKLKKCVQQMEKGQQYIEDTVFQDKDYKRLEQQMRNHMQWSQSFNRSIKEQNQKQSKLEQKQNQV